VLRRLLAVQLTLHPTSASVLRCLEPPPALRFVLRTLRTRASSLNDDARNRLCLAAEGRRSQAVHSFSRAVAAAQPPQARSGTPRRPHRSAPPSPSAEARSVDCPAWRKPAPARAFHSAEAVARMAVAAAAELQATSGAAWARSPRQRRHAGRWYVRRQGSRSTRWLATAIDPSGSRRA
jgi:hypothetical protein